MAENQQNNHDGRSHREQDRDEDHGRDGQNRRREIVIAPEPLPGSVMDPGQAADFAKALVKELFDSLKAAESSSEDTRLFFPEGIGEITVHMKVGGGTAPAVDVEFTVSGGAG